jgi:hypothetical protein
VSSWDGFSTTPANTRSGPDPINPLRIGRLRAKGLSYREIGIVIAREDGRRMPYLSVSVRWAFWEFTCGLRDEDGEKQFKPASVRKSRNISLAYVKCLESAI